MSAENILTMMLEKENEFACSSPIPERKSVNMSMLEIKIEQLKDDKISRGKSLGNRNESQPNLIKTILWICVARIPITIKTNTFVKKIQSILSELSV